MKITDLTEDDQKLLISSTDKEPTALTVEDIKVLQARRDYLTKEQKETFADALAKDLNAPEEPAEPKKEETEKEAVPPVPARSELIKQAFDADLGGMPELMKLKVTELIDLIAKGKVDKTE